METTMLTLIKKENPSTIFKVERVSYRELSCIRVIYTKGSQYIMAVSYCTDTWIAPSPAGPKRVTDGQDVQKMESITDVAKVFCVDTLAEVYHMPMVKEAQLRKLYEYLDESSKAFAIQAVKLSGAYISSARYLFMPYPMIIASITDLEGKFLGSISISMTGEFQILSSTTPRFETIVSPESSRLVGNIYGVLTDGYSK